MIDVIWTKEHRKIDTEQIPDGASLFATGKDSITNLKLRSNYQVDYFIGVDWLIGGKCALVVEPKVENLDYLTMFLECFSHPDSSRAINQVRKDGEKLYDINFDKELIELNNDNFQITPLIIVHFVQVVQSIVKKGLKKGYVTENKKLISKIKGKILIGSTIKNNLRNQNYSVTNCRYDIFTLNCIENKILKKTLIFVRSYLSNSQFDLPKINPVLNYCLSAFKQVDSEVDYKIVRQAKTTNRFYKEYKQGIYLAKLILKHFGFSIQNTSNDLNKTPPFYINMPLLFEIYILKQLKEISGNSILFQFKGKKAVEVDFLDTTHQLIIDTKYKESYINGCKIEDIRQLSGYSRDRKILKAFGINDDNLAIVDCLVIYPNQQSPIEKIEEYNCKTEIDGFVKFYKIGVKLPEKHITKKSSGRKKPRR